MSGNDTNMSAEVVSSNKRRIEDYYGGLVHDDSKMILMATIPTARCQNNGNFAQVALWYRLGIQKAGQDSNSHKLHSLQKLHNFVDYLAKHVDSSQQENDDSNDNEDDEDDDDDSNDSNDDYNSDDYNSNVPNDLELPIHKALIVKAVRKLKQAGSNPVFI